MAVEQLQLVLLVGLRVLDQIRCVLEPPPAASLPPLFEVLARHERNIFSARAMTAGWLIERPSCLANSLSCLRNDSGSLRLKVLTIPLSYLSQELLGCQHSGVPQSCFRTPTTRSTSHLLAEVALKSFGRLAAAA